MDKRKMVRRDPMELAPRFSENKVYTMIPGTDTRVSFSSRQYDFMRIYSATGNWQQALVASKTKMHEALTWFKTSKFKKFIHALRRMTAESNNLSVDFIRSSAMQGLTGKKQFDRQTTKILELSAKMAGAVQTERPGIFDKADSFVFVASKGMAPSNPIIDVQAEA